MFPISNMNEFELLFTTHFSEVSSELVQHCVKVHLFHKILSVEQMQLNCFLTSAGMHENSHSP